MRLKSFHVRVFRNVIDSGPIRIDGNTCLVGKNEAGKSALISALHRLNPAKPVALALLDEYPRWLKKEHEISGEIENATPIEATYELNEVEAAEIEEKFGKDILTSRLVTVSRKYVGKDMEISAPISYRTFVSQFIAQHAPEVVRSKLASATTSDELIELLDRNILLEGVSDFIYLTAFSSHLKAAGGASIPENARLLPVGGVSSMGCVRTTRGDHGARSAGGPDRQA